jgi:hypothetical protein
MATPMLIVQTVRREGPNSTSRQVGAADKAAGAPLAPSLIALALGSKSRWFD